MQNRKKSSLILLALFIIAQTFGAVLLFPRGAAAIPTEDTTTPPAVIASQVKMTAADKVLAATKKVEDNFLVTLKKGLILSASITLRNTLVTMARTAAEQTMTGLTTGDWGQSPMFYTASFAQMGKDIAGNSAGMFLDSMNDAFKGTLGFDICTPPNLPNLQLTIGLSLAQQNMPAAYKPNCTLSKLTANWESFASNVQDRFSSFKNLPGVGSIAILQETVRGSLSQQSSDVGIFLTMQDELQKQQAAKLAAANLQRQEGQGSKAVTTITGNIKTPAFLVQSSNANQVNSLQKTQGDEMQAGMNVLNDIPESVVSAFLTTFVSKGFTDFMNKKLFSKGLVQNPDAYNGQTGNYADLAQFTREADQVTRTNFSYSVKQIDVLTNFTSCPDSDIRLASNCVVDNNFAQAVRQADQDKPLTVQDAISEGLINGNLPLIGPNDGRNATPDCYQKGYCYSNLVKLREARIIPIGWEIAAQKVAGLEVVTLNQAKDLFSTSTSKFYHLIDPNWVLRYPKTQCNAFVYGPQLTASGASSRSQTCVDQPSCVKQSDDGTCLSWGYCAAEQNTFRLGGQSCLGVYDSCRTFTNRQGSAVSYLTNTVDSAGCDANTVGCKWYSTGQNANGTWNSNSKIYLNKNIEDQSCKPDGEGCSRFIRTATGMGTNLLTNGGFENYSGTKDSGVSEFPGWTIALNQPIDMPGKAVSTAYSGEVGIKMPQYSGSSNVSLMLDSVNSPIKIVPKSFSRYFALSLEVNVAGDICAGNCWQLSLQTLVGTVATNVEILNGSDYQWGNSIVKGAWQKKYLIVKVAPNVSALKPFVIGGANNNPNDVVTLDAFQLEEIDSPYPTSMHEFNDYVTTNAVYLKKAPSYLNCYDTKAATDNSANPTSISLTYGQPLDANNINLNNDVVKTATQKGCSDFARLCTANDVGCQAFAPTDVSGSVVNGSVAYSDYCPQECAGYQTLSKAATNFEKAEFPLYFIPSTAKTCSASQAGCDEFTNLDALASGGESREYYTQLRQCAQLPLEQANCQSFYTWVGTGVTGFQLQSYLLKTDSTITNEPAVTSANHGANDLCDASTFKTNPDCRQFYDATGHVSYKLYTKTISCSKDCHPYRRTISSEADCSFAQGTWKNGECLFMAIPSQGTKCSAANAGCRQYKGNFSGDQAIVYQNDFSAGDAMGAGQIQSSAAGQVLWVNSQQARGLYNLYAPAFASSAQGDYTVSFWFKYPSGGENKFSIDIRATDLNGAVQTTVRENKATDWDDAEWHLYSFNFTVDSGFAAGNYVVGLNSSNPFYIDNLKITKVSDKKYLIKGTDALPASCNQDLLSGAGMPQAQLGCREYRDASNTLNYLKSFSGICSSDKVGCEALIDTRNNLTPFAKDYNNSTVAVPADSLIYLVNNAAAQCHNTDKGCTAVGLPTLTIDPSGNEAVKKDANGKEAWNLQYYKLDPDAYDAVDTVLCQESQQGCEEFKDAKGASTFFKSPGDKLCEYKKIGSGYAWYKKGTSVACDTKAYYSDGNEQVLKKIDSGYDGWVGACSSGADRCTAFVDPTDKSASVTDRAAAGKAYYYINNEMLDTASCSTVSRKNGCVLFNDTSKTNLTYNAYQTYINSKADSGQNVDTVKIDNSNVIIPKTTRFNEGTYGSNVLAPSGDTTTEYCDQFSYCKEMEICLQQEDNLTTCMSKMLTSDANPSIAGQQLQCLNNTTTTFHPSTTVGRYGCAEADDCNDRLRAEENARCTAAQLLKKDTNVIVKVTRDRECAAWYDCQSSHWAWDQGTNKFVEVCDSVGLCDQLTNGDQPSCQKFLRKEDASNLLTYNAPLQTKYADRALGWYDLEYSGMSSPLMAPVQFLTALKPTSTSSNYGLINQSSVSCSQDSDCYAPASSFCWDKSGAEASAYCKCVIASHKCIRSINASTKLLESPAPSCRAYPQADAPFPYSVKDDVSYANANISYVKAIDTNNSDKTRGDFGCFYQKVNYGGGSITKYVPMAKAYNPAAEFGFCQDLPDQPCTCNESTGSATTVNINTATMCSSSDCGEEGYCMKRDKKKVVYNGWAGYCLEYDNSVVLNNDPSQHPCLSWYPTQSMAGLNDLQNNYESAGYNPPSETGSLFTVDSAGWDPLKSSIAYTSTEQIRFNVRRDSENSYVEQWFPTGSNGGLNFNVADIAGISLQCVNESISGGTGNDWCLVGAGDKNAASYWYKASTGDNGFAKSFNNAGGFVLTKGLKEPTAMNFYAMSQGSLGDHSEIPAAYKAWTYWQAVWNPGDMGIEGYSFDDQCDMNLGNQQHLFCLKKGADILNFPTTASDAFLEGNCGAGTGDVHKYFGVRMLFDETGKYRGVWTSMCNTGEDQNSQVLNVRFLMHGFATELAQVNQLDGNGGGNLNKARTQKLYELSTSPTTPIRTTTTGTGATAASYNIDYTSRLFMGSAEGYSIPGASKMRLYIPDKYSAKDTDAQNPGGSEWTRLAGVYSNGNFGGKPLGCQSTGAFTGGNTLQCDSTNDENREVTPINNINNTGGFKQLNTLFAKVYNIYAWTGSYNTTGDSYDRSENISAGGSAPMIAARVKTGRTDSAGNPIYGAMRDSITLLTQGNLDGQQADDVNGTNGQLRANIQFYAWANNNQMPIKRIMVDWGDGTPIQGADVPGKFKNHKPRCQRSSNEKLGQCGYSTVSEGVHNGFSCATDDDCSLTKSRSGETAHCVKNEDSRQAYQDWFGDTAAACVEGYFEYSHMYVCDDPSALTKCGDNIPGTTTPATTDCWEPADNGGRACVFVPRVQAWDNWGWCNGECLGEPGGSGCYTQSEDNDECRSGKMIKGASTRFAGRIIITP